MGKDGDTPGGECSFFDAKVFIDEVAGSEGFDAILKVSEPLVVKGNSAATGDSDAGG